MPLPRWSCVIILLATCLLTLACDAPPALERLDDQARILAFGDSLTHGTGAPADAAYPAVLGALLGREVIAAGVPGEVAAEGRRRLPGVLERVRPDLLILCHGGNDILRGRDLAAAGRHIEAMIDMAQERGIAVVLIGVPARGLFTDTAELYYGVAERTDVPLEDEALAEIIGSPELKSDAVHPNAAGYRRLAQAVHRLLARSGAVADRDS